jgi:glycosyltransferase involved in cell wall biosynthesis
MRVLVVTNIYPTRERPANGTFVANQVRSLSQVGVQTEVLFLDRAGRGRRAYRGLGRHVLTAAEASNPDIVHVMYGGVMADVVSRVVADRPVLVSYCGDDLQGNAGNGLLGALSGRYNVAASARAARRAAGVIVKSRNLFEALPRNLDPSRVWIVPNGVDFALFAPQDRFECQRELGWRSARAHVLFPAPPSRGEKRYPLAVAAVRLLRQDGHDVDLHVLDGIPHDQIPVWLNAANAIVLTSSREGSPNVVKEALACNVPIVSVDVGDVRERFAGIEGCYISGATPQELSRHLVEAVERTDSIDARTRIADLSLERVATKIKEIYETLLAER